MPLFRRPLVSPTKAYNFIGSEHDWRRLVINSLKYYKEVYLCDSEAIRELYPKEIKVIKSSQTAKRVEFLRRQNTAVFLGERNRRELKNSWNELRYLVLRSNMKDFIEVLRLNLLELNSRTNIQQLRKYK